MIRFDTTCPQCGKEDSVFGRDIICHNCQLEGKLKSNIRCREKTRRIDEEIRGMKPAVKAELHAKLLKEVLEELGD